MISWFERWGSWLLGGLLLVVGAGWLWQRRRRLSAEAQARVLELTTKIAGDKALRDRLLAETQTDYAALDRLDLQNRQNERDLLAQHEETEGLTRDEIRMRLARLGYD